MVGTLFDRAATGIARVALPLPVDRLFDYAVPDAFASDAEVGRRVRVAAGRRQLTGLIVERDPAAPRDTGLKPLLRILDAEPVISASLIRVLSEEARAVLCPVGLALAGAFPAGSAPRSQRALHLTSRGREALRSGAARGAAARLLGLVEARPLPAAILNRRAGEDAEQVAELLKDRLVSWQDVEQGPRARVPQIRMVRLAAAVDVEAVCGEALARAHRQAELLRRVAADGPLPTRALSETTGAAAGLRALADRGLVEIFQAEAELDTPAGLSEDGGRLTLTGEQRAAVDTLGEAVREGRPTTYLLHGITGSGKTEVYLRAVSEALDMGRQALVLVPEITLTHQILGRLRARFGDRLAVLHSGLRPGERLAQWERLRRGDMPIAVGARSALFAPTARLGVIVLDEEHDSAYKNDEGFRYHARSLAARRARADGCPLILGSATPSLETRYAAECGRIERLRLSHRIGSRPLPAVELVDLARERAALPRGRKLILSSQLVRALREALRDGAQSILFLNRRGFSTQIACFECQGVSRCKHCDIALTYHAADEQLRCHYCDYHTRPPDVCPSCGADATALLGIGTERLEEEVRLHFPDARIARLDRDVARRVGATEQILRGLKAGSLDVVVGTQMLAKGHDFPGVRLVGVVNADLGLHFPDFRAAERTFQLLTQVAGRAGRGPSPGRVIVQSYQPDHYAVRPVLHHDYESFYAEEIRHRAALGYPPHGHLGQVVVHGPDETETRAAAVRLAEAARASAPPCEVLGPAPAPIARLRGRYRFQLLLKHRDGEAVWQAGRRVGEAAGGLRGDVRAAVDVHPLDML